MANEQLEYSVFVSEGPVRAGEQRMPDGSRLFWNPLSSVLVTGKDTALLVDPPFTTNQIQAVGDWIEQSGKTLTHIYATHGHGDHWFGAPALIERFPTATLYATIGTIELMRSQATVGRAQLWDLIFPGQIPATPVDAVPVAPDGFTIEGHELRPIELGHTDTENTTALFVPSLGLLIGGDSVYNGVNQYLSEGSDGGFEKWVDALDVIEALNPRIVVAGHKNRDLPDSPAIIDETRRYLKDVIELRDTSNSAQEFFDEMTARHPHHLNKSPLWYGALGLFANAREKTA
jgi:glyoxylase-like metal-dependent hydrolase (beta-lactamase superfamily II)